MDKVISPGGVRLNGRKRETHCLLKNRFSMKKNEEMKKKQISDDDRGPIDSTQCQC